MNPPHIQDQEQRDRALNIDRSFIVQAPAGSGKTELLIQRYLRLLSTVKEPEEIIAITFTRKAAAEMRNRILEALDRAREPQPEQEHARLTWDLACSALKRDQERGWKLQQSPGRLRIQTIDALCSGLTRQLPLLSTFGGQPSISEKPQELYVEAARAAIRHLEQGREWGNAVATLLGHLDNNIPRLEGLLVSMLSKRDQWLRHVVGGGGEWLRREELEGALERVLAEALTELSESFPNGLSSQIFELARFASANLREEENQTSDLLACLDIENIPATTADGIPQWRGLAELLLTKDGGLRKRVDKRAGFPVSNADGKGRCKQMKDAFAALIQHLQGHPGFIARVAQVRGFPPVEYTQEQWQVMRALFLFLKIAVAELRLVMSELGEVDFIEMALGAGTALGKDDAPTDLAMVLDYHIQHILVDEFQDTAYGQFELLRQLTRGWEPDDGRTLFVVGDPMQSIYRFREAEVGLYLKARQDGIDNVLLTPLTLSVNFRSEQGIVEWVNRVFRRVFPEQEDIGKGAVTYAESTPFHPGSSEGAVKIHPFYGRDDKAEARQVRELAQAALCEDTTATVAILVRNRSHLSAIIPELKLAGQRFQALNLEPMARRPVVYDLLALTRALLHPADRISWLAILRAPWCGLSLEDMHALAAGNHNLCIWELIQEPDKRAELSSDGQARLQRIRSILELSLNNYRRVPLHELIEGAWLALGGAAMARSETDLEEAQMLFELLEEFDHGGDIDDFAALDAALNDLYAPPDLEADGRLQLMTMHGAKGLEFDRVIVPGLGKRPRMDESRLMYWLERNALDGTSDLLLAPIKGADTDNDPIYRYLRDLVTEKGRLENSRLLYVAATRARKQLHLLGHIEYDQAKEELKTPASGSLLASLWSASAVREEFQRMSPDDLMEGDAVDAASTDVVSPPIRRLPVDWELPKAELVSPLPQIGSESLQETTQSERLEFDWASESARHIGTLVHRYLQRIALDGAEKWSGQRVSSLHDAFGNALVHLGVPQSELNAAVSRVHAALSQALTDERGRWILSDRHREAKSEYALSSFQNQKLVNIIVDRTFIDNDGVRWIIDYKTGAHEGSDIDTFLDRELARYREKMERYASIFKKLEDRPIKLGLYFPLMSGWRSWDA